MLWTWLLLPLPRWNSAGSVDIPGSPSQVSLSIASIKNEVMLRSVPLKLAPGCGRNGCGQTPRRGWPESSRGGLSLGGGDIVILPLRVGTGAGRSAQEIPQQRHRGGAHDPQVEPCALDSEFDERGKQNCKRQYPFHIHPFRATAQRSVCGIASASRSAATPCPACQPEAALSSWSAGLLTLHHACLFGPQR